jgi:hypothetical protein
MVRRAVRPMTYPTPNGPPPQGPKRSRTPWLIVLAAVVAVALVGGLAYALLGDDPDADCASGSGTESACVDPGAVDPGAAEDAATSGDIDRYGDALAAAIDEQDVDALNAMSCPDADETLAAAIELVDEIEAASTLPAREGEAETYLVPLGLVVDGDARPYEATVVEHDGVFCVQRIVEDSYAGMGEPGDQAA